MSDVIRAATGIQELLKITSTPAGDEALIGKVLRGQVLALAGDYTADIDSAGIGSIEVHVRPSAVSGTATPKFSSRYVADDADRQVATGAAAFTAATQQDLTLTLVGERKCRVTITLAAASSVTLDRAEVNGL